VSTTTTAVRTLTRAGLITGLSVIVAFPSLPAPWYCMPWEDPVCQGIPPVCWCVAHRDPAMTADELTPAPPPAPSKVPGAPVTRDAQ
jgi:hypothetical protein